ncbi:hypothetical protein BSK66_31175 [Paenibacillus odorifer]|uniref:Phage ABA sandwich domain-containing protein n=1 Tax=Paenibacillus odorifer TaxID=189426 RepID=A0A1R0X031_9BACL|nr:MULTISPECIES: hypothetical protein [Paenibacillus]ETT55209.1 hypothetical protein C171_19517 [Paenibacillus sp. FSL H8-237]OMD25453.1 hypothetical protein BJP51_04180 [Paenibacillus odorifer]OME46907.1 hypothetical protein BSK66_31175 [Paenibacillus odorifer]
MTLTREEILAMEPGPALDEITAEIACGRKVRMLNEVTNNSFKPQYDKKVIDEGAGRYNIIPRYSSDISAAWEVLEKFKQYSVMKAAGWGKEYDCRIWVGITGDQWSVQAKTASEAICKAALLAVLGL